MDETPAQPVLSLPVPPRLDQEVYYIDSDRNKLRAVVTRVYTDEILKDCPIGTHFERDSMGVFLVVPEGTRYNEIKIPRGFVVDLEVRLNGVVSKKEHVPYNPIEKGDTRFDSLAENSWVF